MNLPKTVSKSKMFEKRKRNTGFTDNISSPRRSLATVAVISVSLSRCSIQKVQFLRLAPGVGNIFQDFVRILYKSRNSRKTWTVSPLKTHNDCFSRTVSFRSKKLDNWNNENLGLEDR